MYYRYNRHDSSNGGPRFMFGSQLTPLVKKLIIINCVVLFIQIVRGGYPPNSRIEDFFGLVPVDVIKNFYIWQLFTYMFLHGNFGHIFINMFFLWMFGSDIERAWGKERFLKYYFITGVGAGIINVLFTPNSSLPIIGASGAVFGILVAFVLMFPDRKLMFLIFPLPIKAKHLAIIGGILVFLGAAQQMVGQGGGIDHFAHLGGVVVGYIYLKYIQRKNLGRASFRKGPSLWRKTKVVFSILFNLYTKPDIDIDTEVDRILDKISKEGMESLTKKEKEILMKKSMTGKDEDEIRH
jgi:membrane associated rhomboid family serine protease